VLNRHPIARRIATFALVFMLLSVFALSTITLPFDNAFSSTTPLENPNAKSKQEHFSYVPGRLVLKFKENISENEVANTLEANGAHSIEVIKQLGVRIVGVPETILDVTESKLRNNPNVEYVEKDYLLEPQSIPNDPQASEAWHLDITRTFEAFDLAKGDGVTIAILDTGVQPDHPDLADKLRLGYNFYDNSANWSDSCGHGTAVAGMAAAVTDNGIGVVGTAWNSKIVPLKISDANCYGSYSAMGKALVYAADNGAKVANISFLVYDGSYIRDAIKYMYNRGGVIVSSGGNTGIFENYQDNPQMISVSATDGADNLVYYSSYGPYIDFAAPGDGAPTTYTNGRYGYFGGTSAAAPVVTGIIALMFSANPAASPSQIYDALRLSAVDRGNPGYDYQFGWGRVDAYSAVQIMTASNLDTVAPVIVPPSNQVVEAASAGGSPVNYPAPAATDNIGVTSGPTCSPNSGSVFPVGATSVVCTAVDAAGNLGQASFEVTVTDNTPPKISVPTSMTVTTSSTSGTLVSYTVSSTDIVDGSVEVLCSPASGSTFPIGTTTVLCTSSDLHGNSASSSFTVSVLLQAEPKTTDQTAPLVVSIVSPTSGTNVKGTLTISIVATDESGIKYVELYINKVLKKTITNQPFEYGWNTKGVKSGSYQITAIAYDMYGNFSMDTINVIVAKK